MDEHKPFAETNGRRIGTRITLANNKGEYLAMELPIVMDQTVYWAAQAMKKALNNNASLSPLTRDIQWFIERFDAINKDD